MFRVLFILILLSMASLAQARTLLVLGDSISAAYGMPPERGWVQLLASRLSQHQPDIEVVNASISGDTTQGGIARLPLLLQQHQPRWLLLELGGNDGLRGTPPGIIRKNLLRLVTLAQQSGAEVLLLGMRIPPNYGPVYAKKFADNYHWVAQQTATTLIPFFMQAVALRPELMQADGIHPNAEAQPLLLETLWPQLQPLLPGPAES